MVSAAATAISARDTPPALAELARNLPIRPDGVHGYDLTIELEKRGWIGLTFTGPPEAAARLIEAGFAPMAIFKDARGRHAIAVTGRARRPGADGECTTALTKLRIADSRTGTSAWISAKAFQGRQAAQQMMIFFKPKDRSSLSGHGFPLAIAERVDRRFRSQALLRRAHKHPRPNAQMLTLLRRAAAADPCHADARKALHKTAHSLGQPHEHIPKCILE